jgi:hypothetical protein
MARGRLRAIDAMIEKLTMESAGKTFEELSDLLQQEGRAVTGALLGEVLRSCRAGGRVPHGQMDRIFKPPFFYDPSHIARPGEMSISFLLD